MKLIFSLAALPLWLAPAALVLAALLLLGVSTPRLARRVALMGAFAALLPILTSVLAAFSGETVLSFAGRLLRIGSLDLSAGFALDRLSALASLAVIGSLVGGLYLSKNANSTRTTLSLLAAAGALVGVLSDGIGLLLCGAWLSLLAVQALGSTPEGGSQGEPEGASRRALMLAGTGMFALLAASALLFWSLGGRWLDNARYLSDYRPRFEAQGPAAEVNSTVVRKPGTKGSLTFVSYPGAKVYLGVADDSQLRRSEPLGVSPLVRVPVPAGLHKVAIVPADGAIVAGDGFEVAAIDVMQIGDGQDASIRLVGPTQVFSEISQQLEVASLLLSRPLGPLSVGSVFGFALFLGVGLVAVSAQALRGREPWIAFAGSITVLSLLVLRLAPLVVFNSIALLASLLALLPLLLFALRQRRAKKPLPVSALSLVAAGFAACFIGLITPWALLVVAPLLVLLADRLQGSQLAVIAAPASGEALPSDQESAAVATAKKGKHKKAKAAVASPRGKKGSES